MGGRSREELSESLGNLKEVFINREESYSMSID